jgi:hypothetical protein
MAAPDFAFIQCQCLSMIIVNAQLISCAQILVEELDSAAVSALRLAIMEVKQCWSVIGWVTKNLLSRVSPCFGRHVKPFVPTVFVVVSTEELKVTIFLITHLTTVQSCLASATARQAH